MVWDILRLLVTFILPGFYRRIQARNIENIKVQGPVIIAMNHPNAFADPVAFTYVSYPVRLKYLARGDAFKPGLASWLLERIGIVPIFRIQDGGKEGLKKNDEAYRRVNQLLRKNHKIIVFAEGLCIQERRLRPLKKGVARMVFGAYDYLKNDQLRVVPVGVNYSQPDKFRSTLLYNVGEPIFIRDFIQEYRVNPAKAYNRFLQALEPAMKQLITHINDPVNDQLVTQAEALLKKRMRFERSFSARNLYHDFQISAEITEGINRASVTQPEQLAALRNDVSAYFEAVRKQGLRDWVLDPLNRKKQQPLALLIRTLALAAGFPVFVLGLAGNYLPYKASEILVKRLVRVREFYASFLIGVAMLLFWLHYAIVFTVVYWFSDTVIWPISAVFACALSGWFNLHFYFFILKTRGLFRAKRNSAAAGVLSQQRTQLVDRLNKILNKLP